MTAMIENDRMEALKTGAVRQSDQESHSRRQQGPSAPNQVSVVIGIDPGLDGAVFLWSRWDGEDSFAIHDMPTLEVGRSTGTKREYNCEWAARAISFAAEQKHIRGFSAVIEQPIPMPKQASQSTLAMGIGFGLWQGICAALEIPLRVVHPATWKADLFSGSGLYRPPVQKDASPAEKARQQSQRKRVLKNNSRVLAARLFPQLAGYFARAKDDGRAEAALLAYWLRCELEGKWLRCKPRQRPEKPEGSQDA